MAEPSIDLSDGDRPFYSQRSPNPMTRAVVDHIKTLCRNSVNMNWKSSVFDMNTRTTRITLEDYVQRIARFSYSGKENFCAALIFMSRAQTSAIVVRPANMFKLWLTCCMLTEKILNDHCPRNSFFARVGGVKLNDMNSMEKGLLVLLDFNTAVSDTQFRAFADILDPPVIVNVV